MGGRFASALPPEHIREIRRTLGPSRRTGGAAAKPINARAEAIASAAMSGPPQRPNAASSSETRSTTTRLRLPASSPGRSRADGSPLPTGVCGGLARSRWRGSADLHDRHDIGQQVPGPDPRSSSGCPGTGYVADLARRGAWQLGPPASSTRHVNGSPARFDRHMWRLRQSHLASPVDLTGHESLDFDVKELERGPRRKSCGDKVGRPSGSVSTDRAPNRTSRERDPDMQVSNASMGHARSTPCA